MRRGGTDQIQQEEAAHGVDDIRQPDPHGGTGDARCLVKQSCLRFLIGKEMFNAGSDDRLARIGSLDMLGRGYSRHIPKTTGPKPRGF